MALRIMRESIESGQTVDRPDLLASIDEIMTLMDFEGMREFERRLLTTEKLERNIAVDNRAHG